VPRAAEPVRAIGRLTPRGPLVGIQPATDRYRLAFGLPDGSWLTDPTTEPGEWRAGLVAAAIAFFLASLADPPAELEATQADMASLLSSLASGLTRGDQQAMAGYALDAVDDGLPADAVVLRLLPLLPSGEDDGVEILRARYARITATAR